MIPLKTIEELISKHSTLEKDLSSGDIDKKIFAEKSKEYSSLNEIIQVIIANDRELDINSLLNAVEVHKQFIDTHTKDALEHAVDKIKAKGNHDDILRNTLT